MSVRFKNRWLLGSLIACLFNAVAWSADEPTPPTQPTTGPGSSDYPHKKVVKTVYGSEDTQYWLFEPADPKPTSAPVIVFMHGWSAMNPASYSTWIEHLVKRGNIVIYPRYQAQLYSLPTGFTGFAVTSLQNAFAELQKESHVKPDLDKVAAVGHSYGGVIAANLAVLAAKSKLPALKALMCVEPGTGGFGDVYENYSLIPAKTLLICIAGVEDAVVRDVDAKRIFKEATSIAKEDKDYITLFSDRHGKPPMVADHFVPGPTLNPSQTVRWYGVWKWLDGLTDAAFYGTHRNYALGDTPEQRFMGKWSDGQAVIEPKVTKEP